MRIRITLEVEHLGSPTLRMRIANSICVYSSYPHTASLQYNPLWYCFFTLYIYISTSLSSYAHVIKLRFIYTQCHFMLGSDYIYIIVCTIHIRALLRFFICILLLLISLPCITVASASCLYYTLSLVTVSCIMLYFWASFIQYL